jgi:hypothetical protein
VYQQQQQQEQQQDAENPFLDPPFSRIKKVVLFFCRRKSFFTLKLLFFTLEKKSRYAVFGYVAHVCSGWELI